MERNWNVLIVVPNRATQEEINQKKGLKAWFSRLLFFMFRPKPWMAPMSALVLAAFVRKVMNYSYGDAKITIWDEAVKGEITDEIFWRNRFDVCFLTYLTPSRFGAYRVAETAQYYGVPVIAGGIDVSGVSREQSGRDELLDHFDAIYTGHLSTSGLDQIFKDICNDDLEDIYSAKGDYEWIVPAYDLINLSDYFFVALQSSIGCPYSCEFCAVFIIAGNKPLVKPADILEEELRYLKAHGVKVFMDFSDCFGVPTRHYREVVMPLYKKYGMSWITELSIKILIGEDGNSGIIREMKDAGCVGVYLGVESLDVEIAKNNPELVKRAIERCSELKVLVMISFIVDFDPNITFDKLAKNVHQLLDWGVRLYQFSLIALIPGTPLREKAIREGNVLTDDPRDLDGSKPTFRQNVDSISLVEWLRWCYKECYQWKHIVPFVLQVRKIQPRLFWIACQASVHVLRSMMGWKWTDKTAK